MLWYESRLLQVSRLIIVAKSIRNAIHLISAGYREYMHTIYAWLALYLLSIGAPLVKPGCLAV